MDKEKKDFILSSSSKNREFILKKIGVHFTVFSPNISETPLKKKTPIQLTKRLSLKKQTKQKINLKKIYNICRYSCLF